MRGAPRNAGALARARVDRGPFLATAMDLPGLRIDQGTRAPAQRDDYMGRE
jgi:hypothetical protein